MARSKHMKKTLDLMGKVVTVRQTYQRRSDPQDMDEISWVAEDLPEPRAGWVVGKTSLQNGRYFPGHTYGDYDEEDYDPPYLHVKSITHALKVAWWPNLKPVFVPFDAIEIGGWPDRRELKWDQQWKDVQREEVKNWPRDAKGRWTKCNDAAPADTGAK